MLASMAYYEITNCSDVIDQESISNILKEAVTCAILAPASPKKYLLLKTYCMDERCHSIEIFYMLNDMYSEKVISKVTEKKFEEGLKDH